MPVLDAPSPRVAERLTVNRREPRVDGDEVLRRRRLGAVARILERQRPAAISTPPRRRRRSGRLVRLREIGSGARRHVGQAQRLGEIGYAHLGAEEERIAAVGIAPCAAVESPDEEGRFGLHRVFLHAAGRCRTGRRLERSAERELYPALRRYTSHRLEHDERIRRRVALLVPLVCEAQSHRCGRRGRSSRRRDLGIEPLERGSIDRRQTLLNV